ncbi:uncharacterized protein LOC144904683 [Branchiostoma floridae x Branchiostoma belcheri]
MKAAFLLCLVLTTAVVQGNPRVKRDAADPQNNELVRGEFLSDLANLYSLVKRGGPLDSPMHDKGLKAALAVREFRETLEAWDVRKEAQDRRESVLSDLQETVGYKKQVAREGEASKTGLKARESRFLNDLQETMQFLREKDLDA